MTEEMNRERDAPVRVSSSHQELTAIAAEFGLVEIPRMRYSTLFLAQLVQGVASRTVATHTIADALRGLNDETSPPRNTRAAQFKHPPLAGLWKLHFFQASFIPQNIAAYWGLKHGGNRRLDGMVADLFQEHAGEYVEDGFSAHFAHELVIGGYEKRARTQGLSGEWIIYNKLRDCIDVLSLASHQERDDDIHQRLVTFCGEDYSRIVLGEQ